MNPSMRKTICVIDDDEEFTRFVERYLGSVGYEVRAYVSPQTFLDDPAALRCDIFLVDLMLPGMDGIDLISMIRANGDAGIIVVSGKMGPDAFTTALAAGADMFVNKPVRADQLAQAIASLSRRLNVSGEAAVTPWQLNTEDSSLIAPGGQVIKLGSLEQRILAALAKAGAKGYSRAELAQISQVSPSIDDRNLDAAISRLRRKIENQTQRPAPVMTVHGKGYALSSPVALIGKE